jgi:hypothetical protein
MSREPALHRPVVLLGAARSGTKALRAALAAHPRLDAVPHDINYVWKYGHYALPHDELRPDQLTPRLARVIRRCLARFRGPDPAAHLLEKTVSNTLRVAYVRAVLPDARFIHLVRDGRAVAASARRMWQAPADWGRLWQKLATFPPAAVPRYGADYLRAYLRRRLRRDQQVTSWGPRFAGLDQAVARLPLLSVCGLQWRHCVEATLDGLAQIPSECQLEVRYEELVHDPAAQLAAIFRFLDLDTAPEALALARGSLTPDHLGKWRQQIEPAELASLLEEIAPALQRLGYAFDDDPA